MCEFDCASKKILVTNMTEILYYFLLQEKISVLKSWGAVPILCISKGNF